MKILFSATQIFIDPKHKIWHPLKYCSHLYDLTSADIFFTLFKHIPIQSLVPLSGPTFKGLVNSLMSSLTIYTELTSILLDESDFIGSHLTGETYDHFLLSVMVVRIMI